MEAQELRIGNKVIYKGNYKNLKGEIEITKDVMKYLLDVDDEWNLIEPIPLTEKILLNIGCQYLKDAEKDNEILNDIEGEWFVLGSMYVIGKNELNQWVISSSVFGGEFNIPYLHCLQNIIYFLEGKK